MRRSLGVGQQLQSKIMTGLVQRGLEVITRWPYARGATAHQDHCVVGRHTTVAVYPLKALPAGIRELITKLVAVDNGVSCQHNQHRG